MRAVLMIGILFASLMTTAPASAAPAVLGPALRCAPPIASPFHFAPISENGAVRFVATISVDCPDNLPFALALTSSQGCTLTTPNGKIPYGLFLDATYRQPALNCAPGEQIVLTGQGVENFVVYGVAVVNDRMSLPAANYSDPITVRLTF